jgi:hypothetical protein
MTGEGWAYLAGLYEGEGCVVWDGEKLCVKFAMCDEDVLREAQALFGGRGTLSGPIAPSGFGRKPRWCWALASKDSYAFLLGTWGWLRSRRRARAREHVKSWLARPAGNTRKLTRVQRREIKAALVGAPWGTSRRLARQYGVSDGAIAHIRYGRTTA